MGFGGGVLRLLLFGDGLFEIVLDLVGMLFFFVIVIVKVVVVIFVIWCERKYIEVELCCVKLFFFEGLGIDY